MELSVETFLDSVTNPHTKKEYRYGVKAFCEWFGKPAEEILRIRQEDLLPREGEDLVERRFRAARFEREIEKFHDSVMKQGKSINTARTATLGIRQLFRFYQMPLLMRKGTRVTVPTCLAKSLTEGTCLQNLLAMRREHVPANPLFCKSSNSPLAFANHKC